MTLFAATLNTVCERKPRFHKIEDKLKCGRILKRTGSRVEYPLLKYYLLFGL